jgi:hypothetical protein
MADYLLKAGFSEGGVRAMAVDNARALAAAPET